MSYAHDDRRSSYSHGAVKRPRDDYDGNTSDRRNPGNISQSRYNTGNASKPGLTPVHEPPKRSGIGLDSDEWEAPERLSTSIRRQPQNISQQTPNTQGGQTTPATETPLTLGTNTTSLNNRSV